MTLITLIDVGLLTMSSSPRTTLSSRLSKKVRSKKEYEEGLLVLVEVTWVVASCIKTDSWIRWVWGHVLDCGGCIESNNGWWSLNWCVYCDISGRVEWSVLGWKVISEFKYYMLYGKWGEKSLLVRVGERLCRLVEDQNKATKERRGRYCEC